MAKKKKIGLFKKIAEQVKAVGDICRSFIAITTVIVVGLGAIGYFSYTTPPSHLEPSPLHSEPPPLHSEPHAPHTHNISCVSCFLGDNELEVPEQQCIPAIAFFHVMFNENNTRFRPGTFSVQYFLNNLMTLIKSHADSFIGIHSHTPSKGDKCVMHLCKEVKDSALKMLPGINDRLVLDLHASSESVDAFRTILEKMCADNYKQGKELLGADVEEYKLPRYGNVYDITLVKTKLTPLRVKVAFNLDRFSKYRYSGRESREVEDAIRKISTGDGKEHFISIKADDGKTVKAMAFPLLIEYNTKKYCMACHSLSKYCETL